VSIIGLIFAKKSFRTRSNIILAVCLVLLLAYQIELGRWTVTLKLLPIVVTQHLLGGFLILSTLWVIYLNNKQIKQNTSQAVNGLLPWAIVGLVILLAQITLGAWTSTNYASLSCPDFPFCMNDQPTMTMYFKAAFDIFAPTGVNYEGGVLPESIRQTIQMTHRMGALVLLSYMFIFAVFAMRKLNRSPELLKSLYLILALLTVQLCIGITNIIFKLPLITAISHNLVAVLLLLAVITFIFKLAATRQKVFAT
jgi:cytochrome c oxidase assembly protein subunit 15